MASSKLCRRRRAFVFLLVLVSLEGLLSVYSSGEQDDNYNIDRQSSGSSSSSSSSSLRNRHNRRKVTGTTSSTTAQRTPRIVGGTDTSNVPYFILWGGCGATLIHNDIALSAAHCSERDNAQVGPKNRSDNNNWTRVDKVRKHPRYNPESYDYDFAVLKLNGWFQQDTVKLNVNEESPQPGESLQILGFGGQSQTLKQGRVDSISPSICVEQWLRAGYFIDEEAVICAKAIDGVDACTGDSGGPLLLDGSSVQVGVISSGSGCDGRLPTVYSRVSAGLDWITQQICELSDFPPQFCRTFNSGPGQGETRIRVDIILDEFPQDIQWTIKESSSGETVATSGGNFEIPNSLESKFVDLPDNKNYIFTIEDVSGFGDGLGNDGRYKVVTVNKDGNDDNTLVSGGSNLQDSESTTFSIGNAPNPTFDPTPLPTPNPIDEAAAAAFPSLSRPIATQNNNDPNQINQSTLYPSPNWIIPIFNRPALIPTMNPTQSLVISTTTNTQKPSVKPTKQPPTKRPTKRPAKTKSPQLSTSQPSISSRPSVSAISTYFPTNEPSIEKETDEPTLKLTSNPTNNKKTSSPTPVPTPLPTISPTKAETSEPSRNPTRTPTDRPTNDPTRRPTSSPTKEPTESPTKAATDPPTKKPTEFPTKATTDSPTKNPTAFPTKAATDSPTEVPTIEPTPDPTEVQILINAEVEDVDADADADDDDFFRMLLDEIDEDTATTIPTTVRPSPAPSKNLVTPQPTIFSATEIQTPVPTTPQHTFSPTTGSTSAPTISPTTGSTSAPTISPTTPQPTVSQTTEIPSPEPSSVDSLQPTSRPTTIVIEETSEPIETLTPTIIPTRSNVAGPETTAAPVFLPTSSPTFRPSVSSRPSVSMMPSRNPTNKPTEPSISTSNPTNPPIILGPSSTSTPSLVMVQTPSPTAQQFPSAFLFPNLFIPQPFDDPTPVLSSSTVDTLSPTTSLSVEITQEPEENIPSSGPTISTTIIPTLSGSTGVPSVSPSTIGTSSPTMDSRTALPTTVSPTLSTTSSPTTSPSIIPSKSLTVSPTNSPTVFPTASPTSSPRISSTEAPSALPVTGSSSVSVTSNSPTRTRSTSNKPTTQATSVPTAAPTNLQPSSSLSTSPSDEPTISYMGFVSVNISNDPEAISWRIIDAVTKEQLFGYSAGMYNQNTTYSNFFNIQSGGWEFTIQSESLAADVTAEIGILNMVTAVIDPVGKLSLVPGSSATTASTTIQLD
jgi:hypothetical protein